MGPVASLIWRDEHESSCSQGPQQRANAASNRFRWVVNSDRWISFVIVAKLIPEFSIVGRLGGQRLLNLGLQ